VADFTPDTVADQKIKRKGDDMVLRLRPTKDIAAALGGMKRDDQVLVGFALETTDEQANATHKLEKKNLDFIVLNSLRDEGAGFRTDTNKVTIIRRDGSEQAFPLKTKAEVARDIVGELCTALHS
jgi:phosphopantothenoylcysteine decarboxylase/phosphopantothenate--cysteine ligase